MTEPNVSLTAFIYIVKVLYIKVLSITQAVSDALSQRQKLKRRLVFAKENVYCGASLNPNPNNMVTLRHRTKIWSTNTCQYVPWKKIAPQLNNTDAESTICRVEGLKYFCDVTRIFNVI